MNASPKESRILVVFEVVRKVCSCRNAVRSKQRGRGNKGTQKGNQYEFGATPIKAKERTLNER